MGSHPFNNMEKLSYIYIIGNNKKGVLYIGGTSDLMKCIYEHRNGIYKGFSKKFNGKNFYYYKKFEDIEKEIEREKNLKSWKREWKIKFIEENNPDWIDYYESLQDFI